MLAQIVFVSLMVCSVVLSAVVPVQPVDGAERVKRQGLLGEIIEEVVEGAVEGAIEANRPYGMNNILK